MSRSTFRRVLIFLLFVLLVWCSPLDVRSDETSAPALPDAQAVVSFLNQTIVWYRQLTVEQQLANEPSDILFLNDNRQLADEILRLSFDFARARALGLAGQNGTTVNSDPSATQSRYGSLTQLTAKADQQVKDTQAEIEDFRRQLQTASGSKRRTLEATVAETESELQLQQARRDVLHNMLAFASGTAGAGSGTLASEIDELARTVPVAVTESRTPSGTESSQNNANKTAQAAAAPNRTEPSGILALTSDLISLRRKINTLKQADRMTTDLSSSSRSLLQPVVTAVKSLADQGDRLASAPDSQDPAELVQQKKRLDLLTTQFKQLSANVLPLGKQSILLDAYRRNLANWRNSIDDQYDSELKALILRLAILGSVIGLVVGISEVWRKATFRYVHDVRRRYQFLLLRRILMWIMIAIVIAMAFSTELGTLATFAGLLTAGVAVALQNVILSVAGYFFLIGKYGVRVGDRVQIAGVTGDVVDIGLVRLHIMEVGSGGTGARATGRVVVFSNAVVFQPNAGMFKQIPGTNFGWHEISLTLAPNNDYRRVEDRIMSAVNQVFADYRENMVSQQRRMEQSMSPISIRSLDPESRLRLTQAGLEVVIRYPVELSNAAVIDDRITRALLDAISREPRLRLVGSGTPNLQAVPEPGPAATGTG